ncbi:MAG: hypothetical protein ACK5LZ_02540 [Anaerorhabdus sp.]
MKKFLTPQIKRGINFLFYALFLIFSINLIFNTNDIKVKILYALITIIFLFVAIFAEYLEFNYENAIRALNYECNPEKAKSIVDKVESMDFLKSYKKKRILFDLLYYSATLENEKVQLHIQENDRFFRSTIDSLLIRNVSLFISYIHEGEKNQAKKIYPDISKLIVATNRRGKSIVSPLYQPDELEALYYLISNNSKKACRSFEKVNTLYMNNKEKAELYYFWNKALLENGDMRKSNEIYPLFKEVKGLLPYPDEARTSS